MDSENARYADDKLHQSDLGSLLALNDGDAQLALNASRRKLKRLISVNIVLSFILLCGIFIGTLQRLIDLGDKNLYLKKVTADSPMFDKLDVRLEIKQMEATLLTPEPAPIFRQPPSPEVDAAWDRLANVRPIPITRKDVILLGKDPDQASKFPESFGFGRDAYIGRLDVFHVIHCLDQVRREAHFEHYYGKHWGNPGNASELHKIHLSHCFHILLQNLMCAPNLDIYTHFWADAQLNAFPDFNVNHQCIDFEQLLKWQEEHSVPVDDFGAIRRPDDYKPHIMTPKFKELFGYEGPGRYVGDEIA